MTAMHAELAVGRWQTLSLVEQMANVGSEVERALKWSAKGDSEHRDSALERGLELLGLTIADPRHLGRLKELTRVREVLLDYFWGDNAFNSDPQAWRRYFGAFGMAAALERERASVSRGV